MVLENFLSSITGWKQGDPEWDFLLIQKMELATVVSNHSHIIFALCSASRSCYCFGQSKNRLFGRLSLQQIGFDTLAELIHPADRNHFNTAKMLAYTKLNGQPHSVFRELILAFECRVADTNGKYHRVLFRYLCMPSNLKNSINHLILELSLIEGRTPDRQPYGIYLINTQKNTIVARNRGIALTDCQLKVIRLIGKALSPAEKASSLNISIRTYKSHMQSSLDRLVCKDQLQAFTYVRNMGINMM